VLTPLAQAFVDQGVFGFTCCVRTRDSFFTNLQRPFAHVRTVKSEGDYDDDVLAVEEMANISVSQL
jgi:hypothetical protein